MSFWWREMLRATVPEASVYKDANLFLSKNEIGFGSQIAFWFCVPSASNT
jgi:hypothetical protein